MLVINDGYRYFLFRPYADMRKGFYSLAAIVREQMQGDPMSGDIFIFLSRGRNQIKLLRWEQDGFALYTKRLERGTYELPIIDTNGSACRISHYQLQLILQGVSLRAVRYRKRYQQLREKC